MDSYRLKAAFLHPKYWLAWSGILALFISSLLPYGTILFLGRLMGRTASFFVQKRGDIAKRNIELCFPNLSSEEVEKKVRLNFENSGIALLEMGMAWFWPSWRVRDLVQVRDVQHVEKAIINGQGIIFLGAHFLTLEMGARALGLTQPCNAVYRKHSNAVLDYWFYWGRMREHKAMIDRVDFKGMLRASKKVRCSLVCS